MNIQQLYDFCLSKKGVTEHFPFDNNTLAFKIDGKIFLLTSLKDWENNTAKINLKCDPEYAENLRATYNAISPGYHMSKRHWNTVKVHDDVSDNKVLELIDHSYDLIFRSLSKNAQKDILEP